jgi:hypothetical protein
VYEPTPTTQSAARAQTLAQKGVSYTGGEIAGITANALSINGKTPRTIMFTASTQFISSGQVRAERSGLQKGGVVYVMTRSIGGKEIAVLVVEDAGVRNASGGIEYDFYGVNFIPLEDAIIWNKR